MYSQQRESDCSAWAAATTTPSPLHAQTLGMTLQQEDKRALRRKIKVIKILKKRIYAKADFVRIFLLWQKNLIRLNKKAYAQDPLTNNDPQ